MATVELCSVAPSANRSLGVQVKSVLAGALPGSETPRFLDIEGF